MTNPTFPQDAAPIKLYWFALSGHAHRVQLMLSLLDLPHEIIPVDLANGAHKQPDFLKKHPFGQVPVIEDNSVEIWDSVAILIYLAKKYDGANKWLPNDPLEAAKVQQWLTVSAGPLVNGPGSARLVKVFGRDADHGKCLEIAYSLFEVMEKHLNDQAFLASEKPSLADIALYTYVAHSPEGDVDLSTYPAIQKNGSLLSKPCQTSSPCSARKVKLMNHFADNAEIAPAFHAGEISIQRRLGVDDKLARVGPKYIRNFMPEQHRDFFQQLPFLLIGSVDDNGHPWATHLSGLPGFIKSPTDRHLDIDAILPDGDPLGGSLITGQKIGILGIDLSTRRRNRLNGTIAQTKEGKLSIKVDQSFGNCPQYIHPRNVEIAPKREGIEPVKIYDTLNSDLIDTINNANLFFIASRSAELTEDRKSGVDVSHRGGEAGFVQILESSNLVFPDYPGNRFFNTLGNIESDPRVGLLFFDFENSRTLQIKADASIMWSGNERDVHLTIRQIVVNTNTVIRSIQDN